MFRMIQLSLVGAAFALSGCMGTGPTDYKAAEVTRTAVLSGPMMQAAPYDVRRVTVEVPKDLTTTEENGIKPRVDIVWHGERFGDRHAQVDRIMTAALEKGVAGMNGARAVTLDVTMSRFHAVTPRTRQRNPMGAHELGFTYQLRDAKTGDPIGAPVAVSRSFPAYYGARAKAAEAQGITQEVRITNFVAALIAEHLAQAG